MTAEEKHDSFKTKGPWHISVATYPCLDSLQRLLTGFRPQLFKWAQTRVTYSKLFVSPGSTCIYYYYYFLAIHDLVFRILWLDFISWGVYSIKIHCLAKLALCNCSRLKPKFNLECFWKLHVYQRWICMVDKHIPMWVKDEIESLCRDFEQWAWI